MLYGTQVLASKATVFELIPARLAFSKKITEKSALKPAKYMN